MRVLVIEDEVPIARVIKRGLEQHHYDVDLAHDGLEGFELAQEHSYGAIVLDIMLPTMEGWAICQELRNLRIHIPILMLTARGDVDDRVRGLEMGADDYLPKPFEFPELVARVNALVRRDKIHKGRHIQIADLEIDTKEHSVRRAGIEIILTSREYDLLEALASREGQVLTREVITERIWMDEENYSNTVDVYIGLIRKKIDSQSEVKLIHTVRGAGYSLRRPSGS